MLYRVPLAWTGFELTMLVVLGTDCIDGCKANHYTITTTTAPKQIEDYVSGCQWQYKKVKTIYGFHKLVYEWGESSLECFNRETGNYELWQFVPVRYRTR
jgi:hypothetical protein